MTNILFSITKTKLITTLLYSTKSAKVPQCLLQVVLCALYMIGCYFIQRVMILLLCTFALVTLLS